VATSSYVDRFTDTGAGGDIKIKKEELMKVIDLFKQNSGADTPREELPAAEMTN